MLSSDGIETIRTPMSPHVLSRLAHVEDRAARLRLMLLHCPLPRKPWPEDVISWQLLVDRQKEIVYLELRVRRAELLLSTIAINNRTDPESLTINGARIPLRNMSAEAMYYAKQGIGQEASHQQASPDDPGEGRPE